MIFFFLDFRLLCIEVIASAGALLSNDYMNPASNIILQMCYHLKFYDVCSSIVDRKYWVLGVPNAQYLF